MLESLSVVTTLLGGLGLFLVAMKMMTEGLSQSAGPALRSILTRSTRSLPRAIFSGLLMTALVQSSSAVTVASLGFVNAGLIGLQQILGVIYGANVGTTMTAWLVAVTGFKLDVHAIALPAIGVGAFTLVMAKAGGRQGAGKALVGLGLFFIGIDTLSGAFDGLVARFELETITLQGPLGVLAFMLVGIVMTILTQSSSAAIALTITAAAAQIIGLYAAAAMIIGANVGTTSTAVLAAIGATANAKRVASAQVLFNLGTAVVALALLPLMFYFIKSLESLLDLSPNIAVTLALFHSTFNCLGVLLILPLNSRLVRFLEGRFVSTEESLSRPQFLDKTVALTPVLAVNAILMELDRNVRMLAKMATAILRSPTQPEQIDDISKASRRLSRLISLFIVDLQRTALSESVTTDLARLMRVDQYLLTAANSLMTTREQRAAMGQLTADAEAGIAKFQQHCLGMITITNAPPNGDFQTEFSLLRQAMLARHDELKADLLSEGTKGKLELEQMLAAIDYLAQLRLFADQWYKAVVLLRRLHGDIGQMQHTTDEPPRSDAEGNAAQSQATAPAAQQQKPEFEAD